MKIASYFIAIILLFVGFFGNSNYIPRQTVGIGKSLSPEGAVEANKPDEAWQAFRTILSGDFTLIEDEDTRSNIEWVYKMSFKNGACEWKYVMIDFDKDGRNELFIRLSEQNDSGLFRYVDGKIECISWDTVEAICFTVPLKDGRLFEEYNTYLYPTKKLTEFDSQNDKIHYKLYTHIDVNRFLDMNENYTDLLEAFPTITEVNNYYFFQEYENGTPVGEKNQLTEDEWLQMLAMVDELRIPEDEWRDCADFKSTSK